MTLTEILEKNIEHLPTQIRSCFSKISLYPDRLAKLNSLESSLDDQLRENMIDSLLHRHTAFHGEAGSGKTNLLSHIFAMHVAIGIRPARIFAPHTTAHAASDMADRVHKLIDLESYSGDESPWISTFGAVAIRILRDAGRQSRPGAEDYKHRRDSPFDPITAALDLLFEEIRLDARRSRFDVILVDDAEDLTHEQKKLIELLLNDSSIVTISGDPDASISSWSGADGSGIAHFMKLLPEMHSLHLIREDGDHTITAVTRHIRSSDRSYADRHASGRLASGRLASDRLASDRLASDRLAWDPAKRGEHNRPLPDECRIAGLQQYGHRPVRILEAESERAEASVISGSVHELLHSGVDTSRIAVLSRLHHILETVVETMRDMGIRCAKSPRQDVKLSNAWLGPVALMEAAALAARSERIFSPGDEIAFGAALSAVIKSQNSLSWFPQIPTPLRGAFRNAETRHESFAGLDPEFRNDVERIASFIDETLRTPVWYPTALLESALEFLSPEGDTSRLRELARSIRVDGITDGAERILEFTTRARERFGGWADMDSASSQSVRLLTLHAAKGRSFDHVFIAGCEEGITPCFFEGDRRSSSAALLEERRILYVGVSTARRQLTFTWAASRERNGKKYRNTLSRFIKDLPPDLATREKL